MEKKQLILVRHAKSDWSSPAQGDHDRPLSARGRRDAPKAGMWFAENGIQPDLIICSSSQRTRETLELIMQKNAWKDAQTEFSHELYLAAAATIIDLIRGAVKKSDSLMVIGHNPGMDAVLSRFCPDANVGHNEKLMTTAAFAVIEFDNMALENPHLIVFLRPGEYEI